MCREAKRYPEQVLIQTYIFQFSKFCIMCYIHLPNVIGHRPHGWTTPQCGHGDNVIHLGHCFTIILACSLVILCRNLKVCVRILWWSQLVRQKCQKAAHEKWISRTLLLDILAKANSPVWIGLSGEKPGSCFTRIRVQGNFPPRVMASLSLTHYIQISTTLI